MNRHPSDREMKMNVTTRPGVRDSPRPPEFNQMSQIPVEYSEMLIPLARATKPYQASSMM